MKIKLEIWHKDTFVKVDVSLKRIKGTPELRKYGRQIVENGKYVPYWFEGYDGKDFSLGGALQPRLWPDKFKVRRQQCTGRRIERSRSL